VSARRIDERAQLDRLRASGERGEKDCNCKPTDDSSRGAFPTSGA
jgi:hypothetical protein